MASRLKFIKKLNDPQILNLQQLYYSFIFGDSLPETYDTNKTYNCGESILALNENNVYDIMIALDNNITGEFNPGAWRRISLTDILKDGDVLSGGGKDVIMISDTQPTAKNNKLWLKPINEYIIDSSIIENNQQNNK